MLRPCGAFHSSLTSTLRSLFLFALLLTPAFAWSLLQSTTITDKLDHLDIPPCLTNTFARIIGRRSCPPKPNIALIRRPDALLQITLRHRLQSMNLFRRRQTTPATTTTSRQHSARIANPPTMAQEIRPMKSKRQLRLEDFHHLVKPRGEKTAGQRADPVDPVVAGETVRRDRGAKRASWIE